MESTAFSVPPDYAEIKQPDPPTTTGFREAVSA
jgi:hypothetical protein